MNRFQETLAGVLVALLIFGGLAAILAAAWRGKVEAVTLRARIPEDGGWTPAELRVEAGQPLRLRLTSHDVLHGFAIGQSDMPAVDVKPGETSDLTLTFDEPGVYTYYCTRWCSPNHWRMRGTIEVTGESQSTRTHVTPLYLQLGLDIDAIHEARVVPVERPSTLHGAALLDGGLVGDLPPAYRSTHYYRSNNPEQAWEDLRAEPALASLSDQQVWHLVAYLWRSNTTPEALAEGERLYAANCAACHGESGQGDGVFAVEFSPPTTTEGDKQPPAHDTPSTTAFTDPVHMLSASPALLQGKIIRGGMGSGMPMWGTIFTEAQTWNLVSYLYTFVFEEFD